MNLLNNQRGNNKYYCDENIQLPILNVEGIKDCLQKSEFITLNGEIIAVKLKPSERGTERVVKVFSFKEKKLATHLNYTVNFKAGFDFARGGKLHGFSSKVIVTGGMEREMDGGWSVRVAFGEKGALGIYYYLHSDKQKFGNFRFINDFSFKTGTNYKIHLYVKVNDINQRNGDICLTVDDEAGFCLEELEFCNVNCDNSYIEKFLFSVFHGGNDLSYAPKNIKGEIIDVFVDFKELEIYGNE